jgi:hypothetical protein
MGHSGSRTLLERLVESDDAIAFAEKVLALLQQGAFTATYKYAVLIGLIDLSLEGYTAAGTPPEMVTTTQLADVVTRLYWPQVAPFDGSVLRQNTGNPAKIVSLIADARNRLAGGGGVSAARAQRQAPVEYQRLVRDVEWKLAEMPLPRLQEFGGQQDRFIYEIEWDKELKRSEFNDPARFHNAIRFKPGVSTHLVRLDGLLRPLLYREWALQVASINRLPAARLTEHLFGVDRAALRPLLPGLRDLQDDRCFYCKQKLSTPEVDHFLPWARVSLDAIENLVAAHETCNGRKTDHLAAAMHVEDWRARLDDTQTNLTQIANSVKWETAPERTLGVARALYLPMRTGARVWSYADGLIPADPARFRLLLAR